MTVSLVKTKMSKNSVAQRSRSVKVPYKFVDLFAGIGGFHLAFHSLGARCVFASEWDAYAMKTYALNFIDMAPEMFHGGNFKGDITKVPADEIPDFDILTAGFPCQPFSQAGFKKGFNETRGSLFFDIARIIRDKSPSAFFIENVRHLLNHNDGRTFKVIQNTLNDLGYSFHYKVVKASDHGLPQHRPRLFMVGFKDKSIPFKFPSPRPLKMTMDDIFGGKVNKEIGYTLRVGGRGSKINDRRNWDTYYVDGKLKRLSPKEGLMMQGFPARFQLPVSDTQAMKQLGNSVAIPAVQAIAKEIIRGLDYAKSQ